MVIWEVPNIKHLPQRPSPLVRSRAVTLTGSQSFRWQMLSMKFDRSCGPPPSIVRNVGSPRLQRSCRQARPRTRSRGAIYLHLSRQVASGALKK